MLRQPLTDLVRADQQHPVDARERVHNRLPLVKIGTADGDAAICHIGQAIGRAREKHDISWGEALEEQLSCLAAEIARRACHGNGHGILHS
jgi:hypothetical protein